MLNNNNNKKKARNGKRKMKSVNNKIEGIGFQVGAPTSSSRSARNLPLQVIKNDGETYRIRKSELIAPVTCTEIFSAIQYPINPGLALSFPWLSEIARGFEYYKFHKLEFEYVTRTSTLNSGSVILAPDYDNSDAIPTTEAQLTSYKDAVEDALWKDIVCRLNVKDMHSTVDRKLVRRGPVPGDLNLYDGAQMFVGTEGSDLVVGKLWVAYDVEFTCPTKDGGPLTANYTLAHFSNTGDQLLATTVPEIVLWDAQRHNPMGITGYSTGVFIPPAGWYKIDAHATIKTSGSASLGCDLMISKNGASQDEVHSYLADAGNSIAFNTALSISTIVSVDGDDEISLWATATGSGTLNVAGTLNSIIFHLL